MGEMISKPDANPILFGFLNLFFGAVGYFLMGQKKKAMISAVIFFASAIFCFWLGGLVTLGWQFLVAYDAYLLAQKLQAGESIGENENAVGVLNNIFRG